MTYIHEAATDDVHRIMAALDRIEARLKAQADEDAELKAEIEHTDKLQGDVERLRKALERLLLEFDIMIERKLIPDVRGDVIFAEARAALQGGPDA